ncbi:hypothetical protein MNB_SM-4-169 [hydrothermal vent metagenome]|uniref:Uncharacterized protein n=1 Tax=hydrothermal vent metagenome TaxID=652676 RepID=A0A1W1BGN7_9ZZZZ
MKYKIGMFLISLGFISPLIGLVVPFLGFDEITSNSLVAFFMIGGPEIFIIAGGALAGKEAMQNIKTKIFSPAGPTRYAVGSYLFVFALLANLIFSYIVLLELVPICLSIQLNITIAFDILAIISILLMGKEFLIKISRLFSYEGV